MNGKKAKKKESKEKKTQRTEMKKKKKKEEKEKKFINCCGRDSNQQITRLAVEQNKRASNLSATVTHIQLEWQKQQSDKMYRVELFDQKRGGVMTEYWGGGGHNTLFLTNSL